jgi:hypothetical protein
VTALAHDKLALPWHASFTSPAELPPPPAIELGWFARIGWSALLCTALVGGCLTTPIAPAILPNSAQYRPNNSAGSSVVCRAVLIATSQAERSHGHHANAHSEQHRQQSDPQLALQTRSRSQKTKLGVNVVVRPYPISSRSRNAQVNTKMAGSFRRNFGAL